MERTDVCGKVVTGRIGQPLLRDVADLMLHLYQDSPLELSSSLILLPTSRAVRTLREKFIELSEGKAFMLPLIKSVGDIQKDFFFLGKKLNQPIDSDERRLVLADFILKKSQECGLEQPNADMAVSLADDLAALIDEGDFYEVDWQKLYNLAPLDYAEHWQKNLNFLQLIISVFPEFLQRNDKLNIAAWQTAALRKNINEWKSNPPKHSVIALGISGMLPVTAELLSCIADMPGGLVVFRNLDKNMPDEVWNRLDETHPQYQLKHLLQRMGITRADVGYFGKEEIISSHLSHRANFISKALYPASCSDNWQSERGNIPSDALKGVYRVDAKNETEEALAAALIFRSVLETEGKTALLVCPDKSFAKRVSFELQRYGLNIEDSGGQSFLDTPVCVFLNLLAEAAEDFFSFKTCLSLFKHPLAAGGMDVSVFRHKVREWEKSVRDGKKHNPQPCPVPDDIFASLATLYTEGKEILFSDILEAHLSLAEKLAETDRESGQIRLWQTEAGAATAELMSKIAKYSKLYLSKINPFHYASLFKQILNGHVIRSNFKQHPRLDMLGVIESRMQTADTVIIAGLNEGTYPKEAAFSPWLSYSMTKEIGLECPDEKIGLAAMDFMDLFMADEVYLLRSNKKDGAVTVPSRWLLRIDSFAAVVWDNFEGLKDNGFKSFINGFDLPLYSEIKAISPPEPRPSAQYRPRHLSVTEIETFMRDPYSIYARHILKLVPLDDIDKQDDYSEFGTFIHKVLEDFIVYNGVLITDDAFERIISIGERIFSLMDISNSTKAFWWPEFKRIAQQFLQYQQELQPTLSAIFTEQKRDLIIPLSCGDFRLSGRFDRIDFMKDGSCVIIDYKTGEVPSANRVRKGFAPQLPLEAAMLKRGAFKDIGISSNTPISACQFWKLTGKSSGSSILEVCNDDEKVTEVSDMVYDKLVQWLEKYMKEDTPYLAAPRADFQPKYSKYEHLERIKEWKIVDDDISEATDND